MPAAHQHRALAAAAVAVAVAPAALLVVLQNPSASVVDRTVAGAAAAGAAATAPPSVARDVPSEGRAAERASRSGLRSRVPAPAAASTATQTARPAARPTARSARPTGTRYATVALNVRARPSADADVVDVLARGAKVAVIGRPRDGWQRVAHGQVVRWVKASFLAGERPARETGARKTGARETGARASLSGAPCRHGSAVERGLAANAVAVHRAVCARWPEITSYGGTRGGSGSNHNTGHALDVMVRGQRGDDVAAWLRANAKALGVTELIWQQRIWTSQRSGDGWRTMSDRGSATANHLDHIHVSVA
jgi:hypothetical protein